MRRTGFSPDISSPRLLPSIHFLWKAYTLVPHPFSLVDRGKGVFWVAFFNFFLRNNYPLFSLWVFCALFRVFLSFSSVTFFFGVLRGLLQEFSSRKCTKPRGAPAAETRMWNEYDFDLAVCPISVAEHESWPCVVRSPHKRQFAIPP